MQSGYTILEHPADIGVEARGATLSDAFEQAASGMMSILVDAASVDLVRSERVMLRAGDVDQLLVRWLGEILYLFDGRKFLAANCSIERMTDTELNAVITGEAYQPQKHRMKLDIKAVTYHQLCVRREEQGWYVRYFLDI
jgi:SHS2 domain-containing protein